MHRKQKTLTANETIWNTVEQFAWVFRCHVAAPPSVSAGAISKRLVAFREAASVQRQRAELGWTLWRASLAALARRWLDLDGLRERRACADEFHEHEGHPSGGAGVPPSRPTEPVGRRERRRGLLRKTKWRFQGPFSFDGCARPFAASCCPLITSSVPSRFWMLLGFGQKTLGVRKQVVTGMAAVCVSVKLSHSVTREHFKGGPEPLTRSV